jgi:hypothetical protein
LSPTVRQGAEEVLHAINFTDTPYPKLARGFKHTFLKLTSWTFLKQKNEISILPRRSISSATQFRKKSSKEFVVTDQESIISRLQSQSYLWILCARK